MTITQEVLDALPETGGIGRHLPKRRPYARHLPKKPTPRLASDSKRRRDYPIGRSMVICWISTRRFGSRHAMSAACAVSLH